MDERNEDEAGRDAVARGPRDLTGLERAAPPKKAAGLTAVSKSLGILRREGYGPIEGARVLRRMNQEDGFDCPGCAWPDPDGERSHLGEYCENGAKAFAEEATKERADAAFFARHSVAELGALSDFELGRAGRLTEPLVLREGETHYGPISWDAAFELVADELNALKTPNEAIFYTSGRTSNEAAFLYQLFVRQFGTNNLPDCSNMCHESSGVGLGETLGIGKGSVTLEDVENAELIVVMGQNPGTNHPRMLTALQKAKRGGAKIVSVNPLKEVGLLKFQHPQSVRDLLGGGTNLTDLYLQVRIGGDVAFLKAALAVLDRREKERPGSVFDAPFIAKFTEGFEALRDHLARQDAGALAQDAGLTLEDVEAFCDLVVQRKKMVVCWAMGLTQHRNGVDNVREIVNLLLARGSIGIPGAGTCPVRGHSNVQGDRTVGIWERPSEAFLDALGREYGFDPPREHGHSVVHAIEAMHAGQAQVFVAMGGNFLSATPDTDVTAEALRRCSLTAHVSTKLNRSHLVHGRTALILPCLARSERDEGPAGKRFVSVENSMGIVHSSEGALDPAGESLLSEPAIVAGLAAATVRDRSTVDWAALASNYDEIRRGIESVVPGFERYNERVRAPGGFALPNGPRERRFTTDTGKAKFTINAVSDVDVPSGALRLMTIRTHDQFNTTIYGLDDRYRGLEGERRVVMMNADDMAERGLAPESLVDIEGAGDAAGRIARGFLAVPYAIPRGSAATYFPEANVLVPLAVRAHRSHTPASKFIVVTVHATQ